MECLNDGTPEVRNAAISALSSIDKVVGMRPLEKLLEKLDDVRKKKLSEMIGGSTVDPSTVPNSAANPSSERSLSSIEISGPFLEIVTSLTAELDGDARKAALNTLGEDIWTYVGKLTEAQRSMLDDRFKWKAPEMMKRKEGKQGEARAALRRSVRDNGSDLAEQSGKVARSVAVPILNRESYGHLEVEPDKLQIHQTYSGVGPTDWNGALDIISYGSPEQFVEGMKVVCHELAQATAYSEGSSMGDIVKDADRLISCLAKKIVKTFDFNLNGASSRSYKYVLNTLMLTFQNKTLAQAVKDSTLDILFTELLLWLLDERVPQMHDGSQVLRTLKIVMSKILDNADRTSSFVMLIDLLLPLDQSRWPSPAANESLVIRNQKFSDLVVKCLIKLTKELPSTIYDIDLDLILRSIHIYLQELGMDEIWKRRGADDKPLRMVITVLLELVKLRGTAIKSHLSLVPICKQPQPIIVAYILQQELAAIFKKIGDRQTSSIGLYELYRITRLYPQVDIFSQLQNASDAFRTYIRDGLSRMKRCAAAGRTPSNVPLSTIRAQKTGAILPHRSPQSSMCIAEGSSKPNGHTLTSPLVGREVNNAREEENE